jgi:class 3 adenylate cyclase/tetratricopeptide (TPR) repeat protein
MSMRCEFCSIDNPAGSKFCSECGSALVEVSRCVACGSSNGQRQAFCGACGASLRGELAQLGVRPAHIVTQLQASRHRLAGEHKQVTVLFVDVKGSMHLSEEVDVERWYSLMGSFFELLSDGIHRFEGRVDRFTGDGVMAVFGAPFAYEDHARRAAHAALYLHKALADSFADLDYGDLQLSVRMGLNSGEVVVGEIGDDLSLEYAAIGRTAGLAQRMEALAKPDTIAVSESTAKLIEGYFELHELGMFEVKGARAPVRVYELSGPGSLENALELAKRRGFSRFVGRERELDALSAVLARARAERGGLATIVGEPGVGKSRLAWEFLEHLRGDGVEVLEAHGLAHAKALAFTPVLQLLRAYFAISADDDGPLARASVAESLSVLSGDFDAELPLLLDFLGVLDPQRPAAKVDPEARQRRLFALIARILAARSASVPTVLLIEDLQWLDVGSNAFLQSLVAELPGSGVFVVATFRPEYVEPWGSQPHVHRLGLAGLEQSACEALLGDRLGGDPSLDGVASVISQRALGNPFFCEELLTSLVESGFLSGERGEYRLTRTLDEIVLPATVKATLGARIDRLRSDQKELLRVASVIGYQPAEPLLRAVAGLPEEALKDAMRSLVAAELLVERPAEESVQYSFRHPLTHEVAYSSQLSSERARVHREVAILLEQMSPEKLDERAALIAQHWEAAGEYLQAASWSARAAAWVGLSDIAQAGALWGKVGELVQQLPRSPESTVLELGSHFWQLNYGWRLRMSEARAAVHYETGSELARAVGNDISLLLITAVYAQTQGLTGRIEKLVPLAEEVDRLSAKIGDPAVRLVALPSPMYSLFLQGRMTDALALAEEGVALGADDYSLGGQIAGLACPYGYCVMFSGWFKCFMGQLEQAADTLDHALHAAQTQGDLEVEAWTRGIQVILARYAGATQETLVGAMHANEITTRIGSPFSRVWSLFLVGEAQLMLGDSSEAIIAIEASLELARNEGIGLEFEPWRIARLSEALLHTGEHDRAVALASDAVELALQRRTPVALPICYRALAEALCAHGEPSHVIAANAALDSALEMAELTGAIAELPFVEQTRQKLMRLV